MASLQKIPADTAVEEGLRCSFCGREPADGSDLIGASDVFICDECVATCNDLITDDAHDESAADEPADEDAAASTLAAKHTFFRLLTDADVAALLPIDTLMDAMEGALRRFSSGAAG